MAAQTAAGAPGGSGAGGAKGAGGSGALVKVLPYLTVVIAAFAPLAAGVYLLTSLGWSLAERRVFWRSAAEKTACSRGDQGAQQPHWR
jgi:YidC/Oxa1 family membrane protein insertase